MKNVTTEKKPVRLTSLVRRVLRSKEIDFNPNKRGTEVQWMIRGEKQDWLVETRVDEGRGGCEVKAEMPRQVNAGQTGSVFEFLARVNSQCLLPVGVIGFDFGCGRVFFRVGVDLRGVEASRAAILREVLAATQCAVDVCFNALDDILAGNLTSGEAADLVRAADPERSPDKELIDSRLEVEAGDAAIKQGKLEEAIWHFDQALAKRSRFARPYIGKAYALRLMERWVESLEECERALAIEPENARLWANRGSALESLGRSEEALVSCWRAKQLGLDDATLWANRGISLGSLGRFEEAAGALEESLKRDPDEAAIWIYRGAALGELGRHAEALEAFEQALCREPGDATAWYDKGVALEKLGRYKESSFAYEQAEKYRGRDAGRESGGESREASVEDVKDAGLNPASVLWHGAGRRFADAGLFVEALEAYEKALEPQPDSALVLKDKAFALAKLGKDEEALLVYRQLFEANPCDAEVAYYLQALTEKPGKQGRAQSGV